jgi:hypothetical protein
MFVSHFGQTARATWVVQDNTVFHHVGDAVFKLGKNFWAVIHTQAVTRAQVLVDPYAHSF